MLKKIAPPVKHKRGDTYQHFMSVSGLTGAAALEFWQGVEITCDFRIASPVAGTDDFLCHAAVTKGEVVDGTASLVIEVAADLTKLWPLVKIKYDVQVAYGGFVKSSPTYLINCREDVTYVS